MQEESVESFEIAMKGCVFGGSDPGVLCIRLHNVSAKECGCLSVSEGLLSAIAAPQANFSIQNSGQILVLFLLIHHDRLRLLKCEVYCEICYLCFPTRQLGLSIRRHH